MVEYYSYKCWLFLNLPLPFHYYVLLVLHRWHIWLKIFLKLIDWLIYILKFVFLIFGKNVLSFPSYPLKDVRRYTFPSSICIYYTFFIFIIKHQYFILIVVRQQSTITMVLTAPEVDIIWTVSRDKRRMQQSFSVVFVY